MKTHDVSAHPVNRICSVLLQNQTPENHRGKNRSVNALSGEMFDEIYGHNKRYKVQETYYG